MVIEHFLLLFLTGRFRSAWWCCWWTRSEWRWVL